MDTMSLFIQKPNALHTSILFGYKCAPVVRNHRWNDKGSAAEVKLKQ